MIQQPPHVNGVMTLTDAERSDKSKGKAFVLVASPSS
jgi:hypothetical protein